LMVYWKNLDVAFQTFSLLHGIFGTKRWLSEINSRKGKQTPRKNGKLIKSVA